MSLSPDAHAEANSIIIEGDSFSTDAVLTFSSTAQDIYFNAGGHGEHAVILRADGSVEWTGEIADAAKVFWRAVNAAFPLFLDELIKARLAALDGKC